MLNIKKLLTKILGCCYTQTASGNWVYRKYADGRFEGWYKSTATLTIGTAIGSLYQTASNSSISFPITLTELTYADVKGNTSSYGVWSYLITTSTSFVSYRLCSASSRASASYNIAAYISGTWK